MKTLTKIIPVATLILLAGCDNMSHREQNVVGGAALGAVGGAVIGGLVGHGAGVGALIGAGVGGLGGYVYDRNKYGPYDGYYSDGYYSDGYYY